MKEVFWDKVESFPLGRYCFSYQKSYEFLNVPKDCGTCQHLRFGKCSKKLMPNIVVTKDCLVPEEIKTRLTEAQKVVECVETDYSDFPEGVEVTVLKKKEKQNQEG